MDIAMMLIFPNFVAAWIAAQRGHDGYAFVICLSTLATVAWHGYGSPDNGTLWSLEHSLAVICWFMELFKIPPSIGINMLLLMLYPFMARHVWFLVAGVKAILVAGALPYQNYRF